MADEEGHQDDGREDTGQGNPVVGSPDVAAPFGEDGSGVSAPAPSGNWEEFGELNLVPKAQIGEPSLIVDVEGFEGPLDFLLALARKQKLDLTKISILALAEQYLLFIERARKLRLELAADYLVMAAWLAYLKSRLLIPEMPEEDEPSGEELAAMLAFRLRKLEAMREAAAKLMERPSLGQDFFLRGQPEDMSLIRKPQFSASLYDLLTGYASLRQRQSVSLVHVRKRNVWSLPEARDVLMRLVGGLHDWTPVEEILRSYLKLTDVRTTALASSFAASLELVREGHLEIRQTEAFGTIYLRSKQKEAP
ncbi:segregation and condensation protein A [Cohaesibacter haloalkalitolerans]|uniref:segregation and condensation protein A n=1 Tax=Cohaesibacter haloalkalitolerans TaxID=1162980 RepID=UPI000E658452|nr:ScpA family protein [Cohaesibacter haloalkalitolerans]